MYMTMRLSGESGANGLVVHTLVICDRHNDQSHEEPPYREVGGCCREEAVCVELGD